MTDMASERIGRLGFLHSESVDRHDWRGDQDELLLTPEPGHDARRGGRRMNPTAGGEAEHLTRRLAAGDDLGLPAGWAIAEAAYGVPSDIRKRALARLDDHMRSIVEHFEQAYGGSR